MVKAMDELLELFEEIIIFEEEIRNDDKETRTYPDRIKARRLFHDYLEWRFDQIAPKLLDSAEWIHEVEQLKCA
ncbi:MAG: hypothetical protein OEY36_11820 [Gammaproteobacteria bacterium]|nr:hypothetical protein [Gammaproteobacteria bacterium]